MLSGLPRSSVGPPNTKKRRPVRYNARKVISYGRPPFGDGRPYHTRVRKYMIYLDNAATSFPKPETVPEAIVDFMTRVGANPGRSGHRLSVEAERIRFGARERIARLMNHPDPLRVIFTANVTAALNLVLFGMLKPGDRVLATGMEHNAVMRPLRFLEERGVAVTLVDAAPDGTVDPRDLERALDKPARLVCTLHASNVIGTVVPIGEIARICRARNVPYIVDAAQTAGCVPIDLGRDPIDILAFTGHKGLLGPTGTGGMVFSPAFDETCIAPSSSAGPAAARSTSTSRSSSPTVLRAAPLTSPASRGSRRGLTTSLRAAWTISAPTNRRWPAASSRGSARIDGVTVFGTRDPKRRTAAVSFRITGVDNARRVPPAGRGVLTSCAGPGFTARPAPTRPSAPSRRGPSA